MICNSYKPIHQLETCVIQLFCRRISDKNTKAKLPQQLETARRNRGRTYDQHFPSSNEYFRSTNKTFPPSVYRYSITIYHKGGRFCHKRRWFYRRRHRVQQSSVHTTRSSSSWSSIQSIAERLILRQHLRKQFFVESLQNFRICSFF